MKTDTKPSLFRDPADWARDNGWVSRRRAVNMRRRLERLADCIDGAMAGDEGAMLWSAEILKIADSIAPSTTPAQRGGK